MGRAGRSSRFLRLDDRDTKSLLCAETRSRMVTAYLQPEQELDRDSPIVAQLTSLMEQSSNAWPWTPPHRCDEIHILVSVRDRCTHRHLDTSKSGLGFYQQIGRQMEKAQWPARPDLVMCSGPGLDMAFHGRKWDQLHGDTTEFQFVRVLHDGCDDDTRASPVFETLQVVRRRCGMVATRANTTTRAGTTSGGIPRLTQLAVDAVLPQLLRSDPPRFLDQVDCVVDAKLVDANRQLVVHGQVVCYVRFLSWNYGLPILRGERQRHRPKMKAYVSPEMLEQLDWIVTMAGHTGGEEEEEPGDDTTTIEKPLRVLVFVARGCGSHRIHRSCLPSDMPSILVKADR